jgi:hypothetical protein
MAQLVEALCYKTESRGFNTKWDRWDFLLAYSFWPHYGPEVDSAANKWLPGLSSWEEKVDGA